MSDVLALSREQGEGAARAALAALLAAGPDGLAPGDAVARSGLSERRWRRAVDRLESEGRVRRDGKRRVFAVATAAGELVPANDAASVAERARAEARELAYRRGWVLGEVEDVRSLLDGRKVPAPAGGRARAARDYLAELARDVRAAGSVAEVDELAREFAPVAAEVAGLLAAVESGRTEVARTAAWAAGALVEVESDARRLRPLLVDLERAAATWRRSPAPVPFASFSATAARLERAAGRDFVGWGPEAHWTEDPPEGGASRVGKAVGFVLALGSAYAGNAEAAAARMTRERTRVAVWSLLAPTLVRRWELPGHHAAVPGSVNVPAPFAAELVDQMAGLVRRELAEVERRRVELARQRGGGAAEVARAVHARLGAAPLLDSGPGGRLALTAR